MKAILQELNTVVGIKGSMVIAVDGMLIASAFSGIEDETAAALASRIILTTQQSLGRLGFGDVSQLVLTSTHGKIVLVSAGNSFLMVMAALDPRIKSHRR